MAQTNDYRYDAYYDEELGAWVGTADLPNGGGHATAGHSTREAALAEAQDLTQVTAYERDQAARWERGEPSIFD